MKEDSGSNPGGGFIFFVFWNVHASRQNKYNLKKKKKGEILHKYRIRPKNNV